MSARNQGSSNKALVEVLSDHERRISELSRRRPASDGTGECDCEDGQSITVYEQEDEPVNPRIGDFWITED